MSMPEGRDAWDPGRAVETSGPYERREAGRRRRVWIDVPSLFQVTDVVVTFLGPTSRSLRGQTGSRESRTPEGAYFGL